MIGKIKDVVKKLIKKIFGTENNIWLKANLSCFFTGFLFFIFALMLQKASPSQPTMVFTYISEILLSIWFITLESKDKPWEIIKEFFRLMIFFFILVYSLHFCINLSVNYNGFSLIVLSILSCIGILLCSFYLIAKFIDIFLFTKKVFKQIKEKLFNSVQPATSKVKALMENITAFLVSIAGLGIAIKAIIEPLINLFK